MTRTAWSYCEEVNPENKQKRSKLRCNYYKCVNTGGIVRIKERFAMTHYDVKPYQLAPPNVIAYFRDYQQSKSTKKAQKKS